MKALSRDTKVKDYNWHQYDGPLIYSKICELWEKILTVLPMEVHVNLKICKQELANLKVKETIKFNHDII